MGKVKEFLGSAFHFIGVHLFYGALLYICLFCFIFMASLVLNKIHSKTPADDTYDYELESTRAIRAFNAKYKSPTDIQNAKMDGLTQVLSFVTMNQNFTSRCANPSLIEAIKFSPRLKKCHPFLQELVAYIHCYTSVRVFTCTRSKAEQERLVKMGRSLTKNSKHLHSPALAVDLVPYNGRGKINWSDWEKMWMIAAYTDLFLASKGGRCYKGFKPRSGIEFIGITDPYHFEMRKCK